MEEDFKHTTETNIDGVLTLDNLKELLPGVFTRGITHNQYLARIPIKWVAVRGGIHDWTIYYHNAKHDYDYIKRHGDKMTSEAIIKQLVPCDDKAYNMYRF